MIDESMDTEAMKKPAEPWEFRSKPAWQRLIIMLGGIIVNVLLAFLIYAMVLFTWGEDKLPMNQLKNGIAVDSLGHALGFENGDKIVAIDGKVPEYYNEVLPRVLTANEVLVVRNGKAQNIKMPVDLIDKLAKNERQGLLAARAPFFIDYIDTSSANVGAGFKHFDKIVGINDSMPVRFIDDWHALGKTLKNQTITVNVLRDGKPERIKNVKVNAEGRLGIAQVVEYDSLQKLGFFKIKHFSYGFFASFPAGVRETWNKLNFYIDQFKLILKPSTGGYKHVGGFISMGKIFGSEWNWKDFWNRTAFISVILAFMNLLPIPALDGGHVLFTLWEMITRRAPSVKFLTYAQYVGMAFLLLLMVYANGNDIVKLFK
jgi:regulator of sigma E protease